MVSDKCMSSVTKSAAAKEWQIWLVKG
jgi:hypothetical protein